MYVAGMWYYMTWLISEIEYINTDCLPSAQIIMIDIISVSLSRTY